MTTTSVPCTAEPVAPAAAGVVTPLRHVALGDGLLGRWQHRNRRRSIPHGIRNLESAGNLGNLRRVADPAEGAFRGPVFADSDVYKTLEAVAWELGHEDDATLRAFFEDTVALLEQAQDADGYLDSAYQRPDGGREVRVDHASVAEPWTDIAFGHELYCAGHLIQAAVAAARSLRDQRLLGVATRLADLIVRRFGGPDASGYPGHPEIETALVELYRLTGAPEYLDTARAFVDRRGRGWLGPGVFGPAYYQDDAPVRDTTIMRGHAVRALYLNAGATDVYLETGDASLLDALRRQWDDMVSRRSYLTGGTGSRHRDEAFGDAYELPSDRAYAETCAGIAAVHWGWRMYLATGQTHYIDFAETALYNIVADGISESGDAFFYSNPLQLRADHVTAQEEAAACRLGWYYCACCPPNLMRTFASTEAYLGGVRDGELQLVQYTRCRITAEVDGTPVTVEVDTDYPASGTVRVAVLGEGAAPRRPGTLALRMPGWCPAVSVSVDGAAVPVAPADGWLRLDGALRPGAVIDVEFDMTPRVLTADARVDAVRGTAAVRRGPIVYCAEQRDNETDVDDMLLDAAGPLSVTEESTALGPVITGTGRAQQRGEGPLYGVWESTAPGAGAATAVLRLRPYATWGNGAAGGMRVWLPVASVGATTGTGSIRP